MSMKGIYILTNKGNFMVEALIAVAVFAIYALFIFNMLMKNIFLSEELDYVKENVSIIENIQCILITKDLKATMKTKNELTYYMDKNLLDIEEAFSDFEGNILREKPETDEYIKISLVGEELQIETYGDIYGRAVVMKAVA